MSAERLTASYGLNRQVHKAMGETGALFEYSKDPPLRDLFIEWLWKVPRLEDIYIDRGDGQDWNIRVGFPSGSGCTSFHQDTEALAWCAVVLAVREWMDEQR